MSGPPGDEHTSNQSERCTARNKDGSACRAQARDGGLCYFHNPTNAEAIREARRKGGFNRKKPAPNSETPRPHIQSIDDIQRVGEAVIADLFALENSNQRGRTIAGVLAVVLRCWEARELEQLEERLQTVEQNQQSGGGHGWGR